MCSSGIRVIYSLSPRIDDPGLNRHRDRMIVYAAYLNSGCGRRGTGTDVMTRGAPSRLLLLNSVRSCEARFASTSSLVVRRGPHLSITQCHDPELVRVRLGSNG